MRAWRSEHRGGIGMPSGNFGSCSCVHFTINILGKLWIHLFSLTSRLLRIQQQSLLGSLEFDGNQSKKKKNGEFYPRVYPRVYDNSLKIKNKNLWITMTVCVQNEHGILIRSNVCDIL